jgi:hypothetical protein
VANRGFPEVAVVKPVNHHAAQSLWSCNQLASMPGCRRPPETALAAGRTSAKRPRSVVAFRDITRASWAQIDYELVRRSSPPQERGQISRLCVLASGVSAVSEARRAVTQGNGVSAGTPRNRRKRTSTWPPHITRHSLVFRPLEGGADARPWCPGVMGPRNHLRLPVGSRGVRVSRTAQAGRTWRSGVPTALLLVLWPAQTGAGTALAGQLVAARTQATCSAGQLAMGGLGSSTATGTVILTIRVTDVSVDECTLDGYPGVTFIGSHSAALQVSVAHGGPGAAFGQPRHIVLDPSSNPTAAFVITSMDDMAPQQHCAAVPTIRTRLPASAGTFVTHVPPPYKLCRGGATSPGTGPFAVDVSVITSNSVAAGYAPPWSGCQPEELTMSIGEAFAASGAGGYLVTLATRSRPGPLCTLDGYPGVLLLNKAGVVVERFRAGRPAGTFPPLPRPRPVTVGAQDRAQFVFEAADYRAAADAGKGAACPASTTLVVALPGGGQLAAHGMFQLCLQGGVGAFTSAPV